ncbi:MAG: hydroxyethylthiazole kinase [Beijerinckiaceae bacterium]|nr:hydroxyethylthiazole kinase [Beijerinckiaceae bacterium]
MQMVPAPAPGVPDPHTAPWAERCGAVLARLRQRRPRIHALTNPVAQALTANGLLAIGAVPTLTTHPDEIEDFVAGSAAVLLNLGMLDGERFAALPRAAAACARLGRPFVLDPAFADRSLRRRALALAILAETPTIVKLNPAEAAAFASDLPAASCHVITGPVDRIRLGDRHLALANGHPLLQEITAAGCLLGAILAACLAVETDPVVAAAAGLSVLNIAAEQAAGLARGPGSFAMHLIDSLAALTPEDIATGLRLAPSGGDTP